MTVEYLTKPGDRWDLIAFAAYGTIDNITLADGATVNAMSHIISNNPGFTIESVLTEGLLLQVPIIERASVHTDKELLPPWKQ